MKIVVINPILYTCETSYIKKVKSIKDSMIYQLCLEMKNQGHTPILIAAKDYEPGPKDNYDFNVIFLQSQMKKIFKPNCFPYLKGLRKTLGKMDFDFIISSEVFSINSLVVSTFFKNKSIIWHELAKHNNMMKKIPSKIWYNVIARIFFRNTRIVARSENARKFIGKYCNNVSDIYIDHGVNLKEFIPSIKKEKMFIVVSQLIKRKHIDGIISTFYEFLKENEEFSLVIIGSGEEKDKLINLCDKYNISDKVYFEGQKSHKEIIPILAKSQALIINTEKDNSMLTIVESIATCTPIITTPIPYNCNYIKSEKLGIVTEKLGKQDYINIVENNRFYVENCFKFREKVSNEYHVNQFINEYSKRRN